MQGFLYGLVSGSFPWLCQDSEELQGRSMLWVLRASLWVSWLRVRLRVPTRILDQFRRSVEVGMKMGAIMNERERTMYLAQNYQKTLNPEP